MRLNNNILVIIELCILLTTINCHNDVLDNKKLGITNKSIIDDNSYENAIDSYKVTNLKSETSKVEILSDTFKNNINKIKSLYKKVDIVFLIDASSSVGKNNFLSEIKFVKKLLSDFTVSYNYTRVAVVTFSSQGKVHRHIDQISESIEENDKCLLLNYQIPKIEFSGGGTFTYGAFEDAKKIFYDARSDSKKIIFLITDGFSNGGMDPIPLANQLKRDNIAIYTIGIQSGNYAELFSLSSSHKHSYLLDSFVDFESLARKALHIDFKTGNLIPVKDNSLCNILCQNDGNKTSESTQCCDVNAICSCSTLSGHYSCTCEKGYFGTGINGNCELCPNATYWENWNSCRACPDVNHITVRQPAIGISDCVCKNGFKSIESNRCEAITCPELIPPENGYFVKHPSGCGQVLNAACGARCKSGYQLIGSSIRLCQENGVWSGSEAFCVHKTCPELPIPYDGMAVCKNPDLNIVFDYSTKNSTFAELHRISDVELFSEKMPIDTECTFRCKSGYYLVGSNSRNCLPLAKWDGLHTTCKQILCSPLPKIPYGEYDPTDCDAEKIEVGSSCSLKCEFGFELKGPAVKQCNGKRNGIWSQKNKTPKCIDVTPPHLICPSNYDLALHEDFNYTIIHELHRPYLSDNSGDNATLWSKPAIKDNGIKLYLGSHVFQYVAIDSFKNKERCNFTISVIDRTPPQLINGCYDPMPFYISSKFNKNESFIDWEEPQFFDNSHRPIMLNKTLDFGYLNAGEYKGIYTAIDSSNNTNVCTLNVTVKELKCDNLESPLNGQAICAKNYTHTWCTITCHFGFALLFEESDDNYMDNITLHCENKKPKWKQKIIPDCTATSEPKSVEEVISISLGSDNYICNDSDTQSTVREEFMKTLKFHMCENQTDCEITSDVNHCDYGYPDELDSESEVASKSFYSLVKRDLEQQEQEMRLHAKNKLNRTRTNLKINIYTRVAKRLGMWKNNGTRSENIKKLKNELKNINTNTKLRQRLEELRMDLKQLKLDEMIRCVNGSVARKFICAQCPRGTYHNINTNTCQSCPLGSYNDQLGLTECVQCPDNYSTRKAGSKQYSDCKEQCPPGTIARLKLPRGRPSQRLMKSLMPFCRKCEPGEYQPFYDQTECEKCPADYISRRGAYELSECSPRQSSNPCEISGVCGDNGSCVREPINDHLYSCLCQEGYVGSHCEHLLDSCLSTPCYNDGICYHINETHTGCKCPEFYTGQYCEDYVDPCTESTCNAAGNCIELNGMPICECEPGYEGPHCELQIDHCKGNPCDFGNCINTPSGYYCDCPPGVIGRRCHLRPCDYWQCPGNAICIDVPNGLFTTRDNYICKCPKGLKGENCTEIDNPCDSYPCHNNGRCTPKLLRNLHNLSQSLEMEDDDRYDQYTCSCPAYFYGHRCDILTTPDFVMEFEKSSLTDYVKLDGPTYNLTQISMCSWVFTNDTFNYGTIISYATKGSDNSFTLTDYNGFVLYINGNHIITDINVNDGLWHFVCVSWQSEEGLYEIYLDGNLRTTGFNLSANQVIDANGILIVGQEQDDVGGEFSESESFIGKLSYMDLWSRTLKAHEIQEYYITCGPYQGDLYRWSDFKLNIHGKVKINKSEFCKSCLTNLIIPFSTIKYRYGNAFVSCNEGYKMYGNDEVKCLRTSKWKTPLPYCKLIRCGYLAGISNGQIKLTKSSYGGIATITCDEGYYLVGERERVCTINGIWSNKNAKCYSKLKCPALEKPEFGYLIYATENGIIDEKLDDYPIGTLAEIQCSNDTYSNNENLLTCLDNGSWDLPMPQCVILSQENNTIADSRELSSSQETSQESSQNIEIYPDQQFWRSLKQFLFYSCEPINPLKKSEFCEHYGTSFKDITDFEAPDSEEFQNMDLKLLELLQRLIRNNNNDNKIDLNNLFSTILYSDEYNPENVDDRNEIVENSYRFVICLYIDIISMDRDINKHQPLDSNNYETINNINEKIKYSIKQVIQPVFKKYLRTLKMKKSSKDITCDAKKIPAPPIDSHIEKIGKANGEIFISTKNLKEEMLFKGSRVHYKCSPGFRLNNMTYSECMENGKWSEFNSFCEGVTCNPPKFIADQTMLSKIINRKYYFSERILYNCRDGYTSDNKGLIIRCTESGEWTNLIGKCVSN